MQYYLHKHWTCTIMQPRISHLKLGSGLGEASIEQQREDMIIMSMRYDVSSINTDSRGILWHTPPGKLDALCSLLKPF